MNPYAAPAADLTVHPVEGDPGVGYYVEGKNLYCREGAVLPQRCVKTNVQIPRTQMKLHRIYWISPWIFLLLFFGLLPLLIVYFIARKQVAITYGYSVEARQRDRSSAALAGGLGFVVFLIVLIFGFSNEMMLLGWAGLVGTIASLIALGRGGGKLKVVKALPTGYLHVTGSSPEFVKDIREAPAGIGF